VLLVGIVKIVTNLTTNSMVSFTNNFKCTLFYKFYKYVIQRFYGVGQTKLTEKDYLLSYLIVNERFMPIKDCKEQNPLTFVGIMAPIYCGAVAEKPKYYFDNDEEALQKGLIVGETYYLTQENTYGLPAGILKEVSETFSS
jgi:hypothetical protein